VTSLFHPGERVIAKRTIGQIEKGRAYHVQNCRVEFTDFGAEVPVTIVSTWPERQAKEIEVRGGCLHLRLATLWSVGL